MGADVHRPYDGSEELGRVLAVDSYGPTNVDAMELIPGKLHPFLPSSPENIKHTVFQDYDWWADNGPKALADFNDFLLG